jgi:hypothetical protein
MTGRRRIAFRTTRPDRCRVSGTRPLRLPSRDCSTAARSSNPSSPAICRIPGSSPRPVHAGAVTISTAHSTIRRTPSVASSRPLIPCDGPVLTVSDQESRTPSGSRNSGGSGRHAPPSRRSSGLRARGAGLSGWAAAGRLRRTAPRLSAGRTWSRIQCGGGADPATAASCGGGAATPGMTRIP